MRYFALLVSQKPPTPASSTGVRTGEISTSGARSVNGRAAAGSIGAMNRSGVSRTNQVVEAVERAARLQDGVVSRDEARSLGATRWDVRREVDARRWEVHGRQTIAVHRASLDQRAQWRFALHEVGSRAALDGVTALEAGGLRGFTDGLHVSVAHGRKPRRLAIVRVHEIRAWTESDVMGAGLRRVRPAIAAIRATQWLHTDRQAAAVLIMSVQQRIVTASTLASVMSAITRMRRRRLVMGVLADITDGVRAMGELDFAGLCRLAGLPEPSRQVVRLGPRGRVYLDVWWDQWGVIVEVEGAHHDEALNAVDDALRQNSLTASCASLLRIPVLGLRTEPAAFMAQVREILTRRGWTPR